MELYRFLCYVCSADCHQFVGRDNGPLEQQKQESHVCVFICDKNNGTFLVRSAFQPSDQPRTLHALARDA